MWPSTAPTTSPVTRPRPWSAGCPRSGPRPGWSGSTCRGERPAGRCPGPPGIRLAAPPGAAPVLVIGDTGGPAAPYEGARRMARALGEGVGVELTCKGQGHGACNSGNTCVQDVVHACLLDRKVPAAGAVCS
ncbi:alpha/beta hydrolase [Streptomyces pimonensis]|uniref:alpha/beta hydrolase n=1 Tax=Streptomyces pimonensis TaxID=2860288 RepID=UPI003527AE0A